MSLEYPCVYWNNGKCKKFSVDGFESWCVEGPCGEMRPSNADRIRAMSDEELEKFLCALAFARETPWSDLFVEHFCKDCPTVVGILDGKEMKFNECDFADGECPNGSDILWWLKQPAEVE